MVVGNAQVTSAVTSKKRIVLIVNSSIQQLNLPEL
jgi:hypothetical protein